MLTVHLFDFLIGKFVDSEIGFMIDGVLGSSLIRIYNNYRFSIVIRSLNFSMFSVGLAFILAPLGFFVNSLNHLVSLNVVSSLLSIFPFVIDAVFPH